MEPSEKQMAVVFTAIAAQMRGTLSNLGIAVKQIVPEKEREKRSSLDNIAAVIDQSYYRLLRIVDNLSNSGYLAGSKMFHMQCCDMVSLVSDFCSEAESIAADLGLFLRFATPPGHVTCLADPGAIRQMLSQLLSNALKFTPIGGFIKVELRLTRDTWYLSVSDTGCGISEAMMPFIYDRYCHPEMMDPPPHGLGLGLPLCRAIAQGHDGNLLAASTEGRGTTVTFSMPRRECVAVSEPPQVEYNVGFNRALLGLADALPADAFRIRVQG